MSKPLANWEVAQAKTFTNWINAQLKGTAVKDITVDLRDGQILAKLLATLSGEVIHINTKPTMRIHMVENVGKCLRFIRDHNVKLVNISAEGIVDGIPNLTLGLIWTLILRFVMHDDILNNEGLSTKQGLLLWCQKKVESYKNVRIVDFTTSWRDGLGLCALIHHHRPNLIEYAKLTKENSLYNLNLAFDVAYQHLHVPKILDPADMAKLDECSIMTYIAQLYNVFSSLDLTELSVRRVKSFLTFIMQIHSMCSDYDKRTRSLLDEILAKMQEFSTTLDLSTYLAVRDALVAFKDYRKTKRRQIVQEKDDLSTLYTSIQTKLRFQKLPPYQAPTGLLPSDFNKHIHDLRKTETARKKQLNAFMSSIKLRYEKTFADLANSLYDKIQSVKTAAHVTDFGPDLNTTLDKQNELLSKLKSISQEKAPVNNAERLCEEANIESNNLTEHTTDDLEFEINLVEKLIQKNIAAIQGQIAEASGSGISAQQMKEYKETYLHFDVDGDQLLNRYEFKTCLSAYGLIKINFEGSDDKFECIFQDVAQGGSFVPFENFVEYMNRLAGSSMDQPQIMNSFQTLAKGRPILTTEDCTAAGLQKEEIEFITTNIPQTSSGGYDYSAFLKQKFCFDPHSLIK